MSFYWTVGLLDTKIRVRISKKYFSKNTPVTKN
jgi:hypothetical protein